MQNLLIIKDPIRQFRDKEDEEEHGRGETKISAEKLKHNLMLLTMNMLTKHVDQQFSVSQSLEQNKLLWARSMLKNKKLQDIIATFTQRVKDVIETETKERRKEVQQYLSTIRPPEYSINRAELFFQNKHVPDPN